MLYIFTGNGKGKTTAALGQAVRAVGEGKRVLMVQFIKGPWASGEDEILMSHPVQNGGGFKLVKMGKGFVGILGDSLPREEHEQAARDALAFAQQEGLSDAWDMIILDEVNNAVSLGLISAISVLDFLQATSHKLQAIILTGREAPQEFIDRADLVTEMREVKHQYNEGKKARRGLEY